MSEKSIYQERKALGLCGRCGKRAPEEGHSICRECIDKLKNNKLERSLCDHCCKTSTCKKNKSKLITECDDFENQFEHNKNLKIHGIRQTRFVPRRWPYGWCYVCCKQLDNKNKKLCEKHEDWIWLPPKKKEKH